MGYSPKKFQPKRDERPWQVHPAWRGIGCILVILVPIMAWAGAAVFLERNTFFNLPENITEPMIFKYSQYDWLNQVIHWLNINLGGRGLTSGQILFTLAFMVIGYVILVIIYGVMYRVAGPPRYGPLDAPPIRKGRRR